MKNIKTNLLQIRCDANELMIKGRDIYSLLRKNRKYDGRILETKLSGTRKRIEKGKDVLLSSGYTVNKNSLIENLDTYIVKVVMEILTDKSIDLMKDEFKSHNDLLVLLALKLEYSYGQIIDNFEARHYIRNKTLKSEVSELLDMLLFTNYERNILSNKVKEHEKDEYKIFINYK